MEGMAEPQGRAQPCPAPSLQLTCLPQSPSVDAPLRLVLQVSAPPRCIIKPSGTSVSVSAFLNISLVPPDRPPVQLSSMAMVRGGLGFLVQSPQCIWEQCPPSCVVRHWCHCSEGHWTSGMSCPGCPLPAVSQPSPSPGNQAECQGVSAREGTACAAGPTTVWGESHGGMGRVPSTPYSQLLPSVQVSHLFQAVSTGVTRGESMVMAWEPLHPPTAWGGLGRGCPFRIPTYSPLCPGWQLCHYTDPSSSPTAVLTAGPTENPAAAHHHAHH